MKLGLGTIRLSIRFADPTHVLLLRQMVVISVRERHDEAFAEECDADDDADREDEASYIAHFRKVHPNRRSWSEDVKSKPDPDTCHDEDGPNYLQNPGRALSPGPPQRGCDSLRKCIRFAYSP